MFSKTKANGRDELPSTSGKSGMPSIISADFRVTGNMTSDGEVQLDGAVEGNLKAKSVAVGDSGSVRGEVRADKVHVRGTITGPIHARTVEIAKSAKVTGDVFYESLTVETGAVIDGACKRWDADKFDKLGETKALPPAPSVPRIAAAAS
ncbi:MAG: polymer-forming cytoskeletal protein [Methylocystis sp.]